MAKSKKKFYVVWEGHTPGIYATWQECKQQVDAYPGAKYKSFRTKQEAEEAFYSDPTDYYQKKTKISRTPKSYKYIAEVDQGALAVDAACSGNPGKVEYRGVWIANDDVLFRQGPYAMGTNNIGEFLAIVHALAYFKITGEKDVTIYTDSRTAMAWVRNKKIKSKLRSSARNKKLFELMARAERWLHNNTYENPIKKWKTKEWGEIPADFGRK